MKDLEEYPEFEKMVTGKSEATKRKYKTVLEQYCEFTGMDPEELIDEAEEDWNSSRREQGEVELKIKQFQEHLEEKYSGKTVRNKIFCIKSFYSANNYPQDVKAPKASPTNKSLKIRSEDVKKLVDAAPTLRDRAIVLMMFQSGMDVSTVCSLDYRHVKRGLERDEEPMPIEVQRPKEKVNYTTFVLRDTMDALKAYLNHRKQKPVERNEKNVATERAGEPSLDDPLFVKERSRGNGKRLRPPLIQKMMRKTAVESGLVSREEMESSKMNPCRPHALRKGFSSILELNGINSNIVDGFLGHSIDYDSAYSQQTEEELAEQYMEASEDLRITGSQEITEKRVENLHTKLGERGEQIDNLEKKVEELEKELKRQRELMELFSELLEEKPELKKEFKEMF